MELLLLRLLKKQEDGSYKVVGFMKLSTTPQLKGLSWIQNRIAVKDTWYIPTSYTGILYDRADLYTGITLSDGAKVFENYELEDERGNKYPVKRVPGGLAIPTWPNCTDRKWDFYTPLSEMQNHAWAKHTKITGIKGVSND